jgi:hypothetical protein
MAGVRTCAKKQVLGAAPYGDRNYGCGWTTWLDGCEGTVTDCGVYGATLVWLVCKAGYHLVNNRTCEPDNERTPPRGPSCSQGGSESPTPNPVDGNPFVIFDGAKIEEATDFASGDGRFSVKRFYRSLSYADGPPLNQPIRASAGLWRFDFEIELHLTGDAGAATLHLPSGVSYVFNRSGNVFALSQSSSPQTRYTLELIGAAPKDWFTVGRSVSRWRLTDRLENRAWTLQTFKDSYLIARPLASSQNGYAWNYGYDSSGVLQGIRDSFGRQFSFVWNYAYLQYSSPIITAKISMTIQSIGLPGGGKVTYDYDPPLDSNGNADWETRKLLSATVSNSAGRTLDSTTYQYEDSNDDRLLTGITDGRGVRYATFAYDGRGRAISTSHGKG